MLWGPGKHKHQANSENTIWNRNKLCRQRMCFTV